MEAAPKVEFVDRYAASLSSIQTSHDFNVLASELTTCMLLLRKTTAFQEQIGGQLGVPSDPATKGLSDRLELAHNKAKADQRKWYASKLSPKRFGDKLAVGGADDLPPVQVQERELTEAERAVRVLNALKSTPDLIASLVSGVQG